MSLLLRTLLLSPVSGMRQLTPLLVLAAVSYPVFRSWLPASHLNRLYMAAPCIPASALIRFVSLPLYPMVFLSRDMHSGTSQSRHPVLLRQPLSHHLSPSGGFLSRQVRYGIRGSLPVHRYGPDTPGFHPAANVPGRLFGRSVLSAHMDSL